MADYIATARSNYFLLKDEAAFRAWAEALDFEVIERTDEGVKRLGFLAETDHGTIPWHRYDEKTAEDVEFDFAAELAAHLVNEPGNVAIYMEAGAEKMRFVDGYATAVNPDGEYRTVALGDILKLAREIGLPESVPVYAQPEH